VIYLAEGPPVEHPTVDFCSGPAILCQANIDSLVSSAFAIGVTLLICFLMAAKLKPGTPGKFQMIFELIYGYVKGQVVEAVDAKATFIVPLALTIFIYILIGNWLDFLPLTGYFHPANSDLNQTAAMAVVVILLVTGYAIKVQGVRGYLHHFTRPLDMNLAVRVAYTPLNIIEELAKPLTLALRLFGNIFGGLVMLFVLATLVPQIPLPFVPVLLSAVLVVAWKLFDVLFIGLIQAFIFMLLTIIYFGMARQGAHEEHA